jgi:hypothetical protein
MSLQTWPLERLLNDGEEDVVWILAHNRCIVVQPWCVLLNQLFPQIGQGCTLKAIKHAIKIELGNFPTNLNNNGVEVVHVCTVRINSLHCNKSYKDIIVTFFYIYLEAITLTIAPLCASIRSNSFACILLTSNTSSNP